MPLQSESMGSDDIFHDPRAARRALGLPEDFKLKEGCGPQPVDIDLLRKHLRDDLDIATTNDMTSLTSTYKEWHDAWMDVLAEADSDE